MAVACETKRVLGVGKVTVDSGIAAYQAGVGIFCRCASLWKRSGSLPHEVQPAASSRANSCTYRQSRAISTARASCEILWFKSPARWLWQGIHEEGGKYYGCSRPVHARHVPVAVSDHVGLLPH